MTFRVLLLLLLRSIRLCVRLCCRWATLCLFFQFWPFLFWPSERASERTLLLTAATPAFCCTQRELLSLFRPLSREKLLLFVRSFKRSCACMAEKFSISLTELFDVRSAARARSFCFSFALAMANAFVCVCVLVRRRALLLHAESFGAKLGRKSALSAPPLRLQQKQRPTAAAGKLNARLSIQAGSSNDYSRFSATAISAQFSSQPAPTACRCSLRDARYRSQRLFSPSRVDSARESRIGSGRQQRAISPLLSAAHSLARRERLCRCSAPLCKS